MSCGEPWPYNYNYNYWPYSYNEYCTCQKCPCCGKIVKPQPYAYNQWQGLGGTAGSGITYRAEGTFGDCTCAPTAPVATVPKS